MAIRFQWLLGIPLLSLILAGSAHASDSTLLRLQGSNTIGAELAPALVSAWLREKGYSQVGYESTGIQEGYVQGRTADGSNVRVEIRAHGSSTGFTGLDAGLSDIAMSSRPIKTKEVKSLARFGAMDEHRSEFVLGLDGIAVVVHRDNPVQRLKKAQLHRLFAGEITDWSDIGGKPGPVHLYARDANSGTFDTFRSLVLGKAALAKGARRFESNAELSDAVAGDPNGIGFVGLPYIRQARAVAVSDGDSAAIVPGPFAVATEDYALTRRLFLYVPQKDAEPKAREFAEFTASSAGQAVVGQLGFVSQQIVAGDPEVGADAPAEYLDLTREAKRLSLNFRFRAGSIDPDNKALADIPRLVEYMKREENRGRELMLYGFADRHERIPLHSLELSIQRADRVADLLIENGLSATRVRGFGSAVPVASDDTPEGRFKNRRVEVWVR